MPDDTNFIAGNNTPGRNEANNLFPVFLKLEQLSLLIVGGGYVGMEKLQAVVQNAPKTPIKLVATVISDEIKALAAAYNNITLIEKPYAPGDIDEADIVIAALNDPQVSTQVSRDAKQKGKLVNVADKPELCDFYLGSVVRKGSVKIAISTNGKSPTIAKRLKEIISDLLPDELEQLLNQMQAVRNNIKGDFEEKVRRLNALTQSLVEKNNF
ncbi:MAG TPA: bifunctional precorrin-2 dehydrogenase/sirohydrochlorin ferrochelatase [Ferruginibacter sp.]|nr:bifunctional precorrin-2 dehydrogenase/sirohydrochlorin ferrochelatase [Ferruginibacter sp.]HMP21448.1 bifunctional precorrin-2 dehydrogenase/sirohydrochlorin ferrochelatase [Ferruginibacter sp.]